MSAGRLPSETTLVATEVDLEVGVIGSCGCLKGFLKNGGTGAKVGLRWGGWDMR